MLDALCARRVMPGVRPITANKRRAQMTDKPNNTRMTLLFATGFAALLQILVMVFLATNRITVSIAIPLLGIVVAFGLLPAMAYIKSKT